MDYQRTIRDLEQFISGLEKEREGLESKIIKLREAIRFINENGTHEAGPRIHEPMNFISSSRTFLIPPHNISDNVNTSGGKIWTTRSYSSSYKKQTAVDHIVDILKNRPHSMKAEEIISELRKRGVEITLGTLHAHLSKIHKDESVPVEREGYGSYRYLGNLSTLVRNIYSAKSASPENKL